MDEKSVDSRCGYGIEPLFYWDSSLDFYWKLPRSIGQTASTIGQS